MLAKPVVRVWKALDGGGWLWDLLQGEGVGRWRATPGHPMDAQKADLGVLGLEPDSGLCRVTRAVGGPTCMTPFRCHPSMEPSTLALAGVPAPR